ncbi:MAG: hypothetical protein JWP97_329 [Labilithrix sp.]|nr:hypothetical protein [Labilithrix sp.]
MMRKEGHGSCAVCGSSDARALLTTSLGSGEAVTLCGNHDLMHRRAAAPAKTAAELRAMFSDRRDVDRRGGPSDDALADALNAAFVHDRRVSPRRAS